MFILKHMKPEEATGKVADAYTVFPKQIPVPDPLVLMSVSPELTELQSGIIRHYMTHEKLDMGLLAMIRYLVASEEDYKFCVNLNTGLLKMAGGMTDEELKALKEKPENAPLEEFQKALLLFVLKVVKTPEEVTENDVESLRQLGWSDKDIFEAAFHGTSMIGASKLYKAFVKQEGGSRYGLKLSKRLGTFIGTEPFPTTLYLGYFSPHGGFVLSTGGGGCFYELSKYPIEGDSPFSSRHQHRL